MKKNKNQRTRNWSIIVYPESAPENWIDILQKEYVKMVVSPLHDKDVNPDDTLKKAHYHVLFMFDGVKSYNQVKSIADSVNAPIPQIVGSAKGLTRYMLHLDNPDKAQYDSSDLQAFNGADITELLKPISADRYSMIADMLQFIDDNQIMEFEDILTYARLKKLDTWFPLLCDNSAYIIDSAIKSKRNRFKDSNQVSNNGELVNIKTGEVETLDFLKEQDDEQEK